MNNNDLTRLFDQMSPTAEQKETMLTKILEQNNSPSRSFRKSRRKKTMILAAALVFVLITRTVLSINTGLHEKLIEYFNISEQQQDLVAGSIDNPELSITQNDVTVAVKETIADSAGIYAFYEITVPDHMTLPDHLSWELSVLMTERDKNGKDNGGGAGSAEILEQDAHHAVGMVSYFATVDPIKKGPVKLYLRNLGYHDGENFSAPFVSIAEGDWIFRWDIANNDSGKTMKPYYPLKLHEKGGTITEISISPISFNLRIVGDNALLGPPYLELFDGSHIPIDASTGKSNPGGARFDDELSLYEFQLYHRFSKPIDPDDVKSVVINDIAIPFQPS